MIHCLRLALAAALALVAASAMAADRIRLVVQKTGTLAWELEIIKAHGLDKKANLEIETLELASPEADACPHGRRGGVADGPP